MRIDQKNKIIITWTQNLVSFNELRGKLGGASGVPGSQAVQPGDAITKIKDLTDIEEKIIDVLVFLEFRYFLTATSEGNIYVWKYEKP